jgi:hypothetical protein
MSEVVKRLRERRQQVWEQAKAIADRAADEQRNFSGEEEGQWQQLNAELDALDSRIKNVLDGEQRAKDTEDAYARLSTASRRPRAGPWTSPARPRRSGPCCSARPAPPGVSRSSRKVRSTSGR